MAVEQFVSQGLEISPRESGLEEPAELRIDPQKIAGISLCRTGRGASVQDHVCALLALIELHRATEQKDYLTLAISLGNQLVQEYFKQTGRRLARQRVGAVLL